MRQRCLLKKSFYLWILGKVIPSCALSVPWLLSASPFNELWTSKYFSCDHSSYSRGFGGLVIFLMIFQSNAYLFRSTEKSSLGNLCCFSPLFDLPLHLLQSDPWCWLSFSESTVCSLADSCLALLTPVLFHSHPLTLADTLLNSFWGLSRTVSPCSIWPLSSSYMSTGSSQRVLGKHRIPVSYMGIPRWLLVIFIHWQHNVIFTHGLLNMCWCHRMSCNFGVYHYKW